MLKLVVGKESIITLLGSSLIICYLSNSPHTDNKILSLMRFHNLSDIAIVVGSWPWRIFNITAVVGIQQTLKACRPVCYSFLIGRCSLYFPLSCVCTLLKSWYFAVIILCDIEKFAFKLIVSINICSETFADWPLATSTWKLLILSEEIRLFIKGGPSPTSEWSYSMAFLDLLVEKNP